MTICCEIDFPLLPTLSDEERVRHRFSQPIAVHVARTLDDVRAVLDAVDRSSRRGNWCVGFVAHEAAPAFDPALVTKPGDAAPLAWFAEFSAPESTTEQADVGAFSARPASGPGFHVGEWQPDTSREEFARCVESIRADIRDGRFYQVNYTTRLTTTFSGNAELFYHALQAAQPRGYHAFIDAGDFQLLSVSPELFFSLRDGVVTTQPMKGTAPRGDSPQEDAALADALTHSPKERAENLMIVDLLRNDLSRIATPHSVEVPHLFSLHALPSVWSMTSTVRANLREGVSLYDVFAALFPCGSVTGAPKVESMRAIRDLEAAPRGAYCGAIGMVAPGGAACFNVGIRSVWIEGGAGGRSAVFGVGSGITFDSTVAGESAELVYKSRFVQRASKAFALFETIRLAGGVMPAIDRHMARMAKSARHFRFVFDERAARLLLSHEAAARPSGEFRVKLTNQADGSLSCEVNPLNSLPESMTVSLADACVSSADEFLQHKTTRRETYEHHAPKAGVWDTLLWNERGELTEFTRANVVLDVDGKRLTPPLAAGLLNGTMREALLESGDITQAVLTKDDLARATNVWWVNSLRGELQVVLRPGRDG
jgi:para-aminobenzoate synthetase/4-amino-4-deoxychorismate lyase